MFRKLRKRVVNWILDDYLNVNRSLKIETQKEKLGGGFFSYLTQGILVFLLVFGIVGGFLSAYDILYDKVTSYAVIGFVALVLSFAYSSGKKAWMNLTNLGIAAGYVYIAVSKFWYVNSGYYSILNTINEDAHSYLGVYNGTHYIEKIGNSYSAITYFVIFVGIILVVLFNLQFEYHAGLGYVLLITAPALCFLVYFENMPKSSYLVCLFTGYLALMISGPFKKQKCRKNLQKYVLAGSFVVSLLVVWVMGSMLPERYYTVKAGKSTAKMESEHVVTDLMVYGPDAIFGESFSNTGISGGLLSASPMVRSDYQTDLIVRFTPYSMESVYLKAYTGVEYDGYRWYPVSDILEDGDAARTEERMEESSHALKKMYKDMEDSQGQGVMEIENVGANRSYVYYPYYTDFNQTVMDGDTSRFVYYPSNRNAIIPSQDINPAYLEVPQVCKKAVDAACRQAKLTGTPEVIASRIISFFEENYTYTLKPGYKFGESDYITFFLKKNKKGYCAHFASSAVMMFRNVGIPARYVEGYVFSYNDVVVDGKLDKEAKYEDYFQGYAPLGETGLVTLEIPDANAHAWVEIYIEGKGWVVVDPTPAASPNNEENFWDVFGDLGKQVVSEDVEEGTDNVVSKYLTRATNAMFYVLPVLILVGFAVILVRVLFEKWRLGKMTARERMVLSYQKLCKKMCRREKDFRQLTQVKEQMEYVGRHLKNPQYGDELCERLYDAFFGPPVSEDAYKKLEESINKIRKKV